MNNTGVTYSSGERTPVVLPEMAGLLPPLSGEQLAALEADLLRNGCYSPIIVNEDLVIIDGHNPKWLCKESTIREITFHRTDSATSSQARKNSQKNSWCRCHHHGP